MPANDVVVTAAGLGRPRGRWRVHAAWAVAVALAVGATWWAAAAFGRPTDSPTSATSEAPTFVATEGEVGQLSTVSGTVSFEAGPSALAGGDGVVTSIEVDPAVPIQAGALLVTVDLRPVVAFPGTIPAFRDLAPGVTGPDVAQLRAALGLPEGDVFDMATGQAVRSWQQTLGVEATGTVELGDVVFLPTLPVRGLAARDIVVGARVTAGQALVETVVERPSVTVPADAGGGGLAPGMSADFASGDATYAGTLGPGVVRDNGLTTYAVLDEDGSSACDQVCAAAFPIEGSSQVNVTVQTVPSVSGIVVPSSAVGIEADGSRAVRTPDGTRVPVEIVAESGGMAVVDGVDTGTIVLLFGDSG